MLKVELHTHTSDDPLDRIPHTSAALIDRAAALGYDALAITLHDRQLDVAPLTSYAAARNIVLIPGIERTIEGRHVLLLNFDVGAEQVNTFDDLAHFKRQGKGIVVAPHAFYPTACCLRSKLDEHPELFDAVEYNAMFTESLNFNLQAERWAARHRKPMVGNCDVHRLEQLGTTYSLVDAERHPDAICRAIVDGRVQVVSRPLSWPTAVRLMTLIVGRNLLPRGAASPRVYTPART